MNKTNKKYYARKNKKNFSSSSNRRVRANKYSFFYCLDCQSGEGLVNPLLPELKKISSNEFNFYLYFILKKCIYVNRSFSDAVEFLSIWIEKSPDTLLSALKNSELKLFFNRTEYDHDGDKWYFPKLLKILSPLIKQNLITADKLLFNIFETFDFFSMPEIFVSEIIGYDRLEWCIGQSPEVFKQALLRKVQEFVKQHQTIDIGSHSRKYLNDAIRVINLELALFLKNSIFNYPSIKNFNSSDSSMHFHRTNYNRSNNY
ncbi:MAG TPA: hypothetical protein VGH95_02460 [Candidatus Aquirickettsiella sp.]|jgi:hypothetical protein